MIVRDANEEDYPDILRLSEAFWEHTVYEEPFDEDQCLVMIEACQDAGLLAVVELNEEIFGFVAGIKSPLLASSLANIGVEVAWYIEPNARSAGSGRRLLRYIEDKAKEQGIKYWNMISMQSSNPEKANQVYKKSGYQLVEQSFMKVL